MGVYALSRVLTSVLGDTPQAPGQHVGFLSVRDGRLFGMLLVFEIAPEMKGCDAVTKNLVAKIWLLVMAALRRGALCVMLEPAAKPGEDSAARIIRPGKPGKAGPKS